MSYVIILHSSVSSAVMRYINILSEIIGKLYDGDIIYRISIALYLLRYLFIYFYLFTVFCIAHFP